ncbi:hypothetical protein D4R71_03205 [bacterium]|nr:MAG: hypothetical protein D4R71_03205 [bacterium]
MYRVDRRDFKINDTINPPDKSYHEGEGFDLTIEQILEEQKPQGNNADRKSGLFIFPELSDAIRFSCIMKNSKIYKVQALSDTTSLHRGDMNWTEVMNKFTDNENTLRKLADCYWNGSKTFKPCWEVLVNKVQVISVLYSCEADRKTICSEYKLQVGQNIERLSFFQNNLKGD